jgi:oligoendopeptidase F
VLQRDWFHARARGYATTLQAALHGNDIPASVVENLIQVTKAGVEPLRRYHRLRRRVLGVDSYKLHDLFVPLARHDARYPYDDVEELIIESVAPLGTEYQAHVRAAFRERWIDVFENTGKRSGAYSAPVYGTHPYMLLNFNETLDSVFTLAHEMGHSMHTLLAHRSQPFVYAGYTIFVAEVPSTLNEALFLDLMLTRAKSRDERAVLLQHAVDSIAGTFYTQVMFADFELQAHRLVEADEPVTAEALNAIYEGLLRDYYGDAIDYDALARHTWSRIPHFFSSPYYVYQYATCFATTARLMQDIRSDKPIVAADGVERYLALLRAGGSDFPMRLLAQAGVDLGQPDTVQAVSSELDTLVARLERELGSG